MYTYNVTIETINPTWFVTHVYIGTNLFFNTCIKRWYEIAVLRSIMCIPRHTPHTIQTNHIH